SIRSLTSRASPAYYQTVAHMTSLSQVSVCFLAQRLSFFHDINYHNWSISRHTRLPYSKQIRLGVPWSNSCSTKIADSMTNKRGKFITSVARSIDLVDPIKSAKASGLRYVTDSSPGITRRRFGTGFKYIDPRGKR